MNLVRMANTQEEEVVWVRSPVMSRGSSRSQEQEALRCIVNLTIPDFNPFRMAPHFQSETEYRNTLNKN